MGMSRHVVCYRDNTFDPPREVGIDALIFPPNIAWGNRLPDSKTYVARDLEYLISMSVVGNFERVKVGTLRTFGEMRCSFFRLLIIVSNLGSRWEKHPSFAVKCFWCCHWWQRTKTLTSVNAHRDYTNLTCHRDLWSHSGWSDRMLSQFQVNQLTSLYYALCDK